MIQFLIQTVLKSLSALSCLAVILSDAAALAGIFMGYPIVKVTQLKDPIMAAIFGGFLLGSTFVDIFNQGIGLIFALCYEMKWMLRLYVGLMLLTVILRGSVVFRPPVSSDRDEVPCESLFRLHSGRCMFSVNNFLNV